MQRALVYLALFLSFELLKHENGLSHRATGCLPAAKIRVRDEPLRDAALKCCITRVFATNANGDDHFSSEACIRSLRQNKWCPRSVRVCLHAKTMNSKICSVGLYDVGWC
jgi:hypothetical protein